MEFEGTNRKQDVHHLQMNNREIPETSVNWKVVDIVSRTTPKTRETGVKFKCDVYTSMIVQRNAIVSIQKFVKPTQIPLEVRR